MILSSRTELVEQGQDEGTARLLGEARLQKLDLRGGIARLLLHRLQGGLRGPLPEARAAVGGTIPVLRLAKITRRRALALAAGLGNLVDA